ncbi:DUF1232 domain-containing protein [Kitasatospora sp. NBC_01246]|uniref:YkvA family protein n=1 Tax=Kitasatospora sp. NBC_01246 TaxID=2903570 RepID=UPI002E2F0342|nr:DUF1232 domain-containing protein [Kitasatospora sp. NBC_01246]
MTWLLWPLAISAVGAITTRLIGHRITAILPERLAPAARRLLLAAAVGPRLLRDRRVPRDARAAIALALAYSLSPIQLVPAFIPVLGQADDLLVLALCTRYAVKRIPPHVLNEHLAAHHAGSRHEDDAPAPSDRPRPRSTRRTRRTAPR